MSSTKKSNPFFTHGFDKLCTICYVLLKDTEKTHSIYSTIQKLESPVSVIQVLRSFSNFNIYYGPQMVCTLCYDKTIEVYKFIEMCNKAHENIQHYFRHQKNMKSTKIPETMETDDLKTEDLSSSDTERTNNLWPEVNVTEVQAVQPQTSLNLEEADEKFQEDIKIEIKEEVIWFSEAEDRYLDESEVVRESETKSSSSSLNVSKKLNECNKCNKTFDRISDLKFHESTHTDDETNACQELSSLQARLQAFDAHRKKHIGFKPHNCNNLKRKTSSTPTEPIKVAEDTSNNLPKTSRAAYQKQFELFETWCKENNVQEISEKVMIAYFDMQSKNKMCSSLWSIYSMLKKCIEIYKNVDISGYTELLGFLKKLSEGYTPKRCNILKLDDINRFIEEADDKKYLAMKVVLIMGYNGACRRDELTNMTVDDIKFRTDVIIVDVPNRRGNESRRFIITQKNWIDLIKKYRDLRPKNLNHRRFFLTYRNNCCITTPIGINTMGILPKRIAKYLKLPNAELYTGHCLRRSSLSHMANNRDTDLLIYYCNKE